MSAPDENSKIIRLDKYWPYLITVVSDRIARRTSKIVKEHGGINLSQWRVMAAIGDMPGRTSVEVVTITPMDKGIVSRATKGLLTQGLVVRRASQSDGRISHLYLTSKGKKVYESLIPLVEGVLRHAAQTLSDDDQKRLGQYLGQLMGVIPDQRD